MKRDLTIISSKLKAFSKKFGKQAQWPDVELQFGVVAISIGADPVSEGQHPPFRIERDTTASFAESRYFSAVPLPTEEHLAMLGELEAALAA